MNIKRFFIIIGIVMFTVVTFAPQSWAGSASRHRIEGAVIGIGAVILGAALLDQHRSYHHEAEVVSVRKHHPRPHRPAGYWETHREWVPAKYEKVWNPGHYNRRGHWVRGHWTQIQIESGYWHTERVWVPYR